MAHIFSGRYTAQTSGPFVVFLIGMRINKLWALRSWTRVFTAMPRMLAELKRNPGLGLLRYEILLYWRGAAVLQYWRSFEQLHAYAHARNATHMPAWAEFNRRVGTNGVVGIWHETYTVEPGGYECIYNNMTRFGLAAASTHLSVTGVLDSARQRIGKPLEPHRSSTAGSQ